MQKENAPLDSLLFTVVRIPDSDSTPDILIIKSNNPMSTTAVAPPEPEVSIDAPLISSHCTFLSDLSATIRSRAVPWEV
jgi:hypothetical protein